MMEPARPVSLPPAEGVLGAVGPRLGWAWALRGAALSVLVAFLVVTVGDALDLWGPKGGPLPPAPVGMQEPPPLISPPGAPGPQVQPTGPMSPPPVLARPWPLALWPLEASLAALAAALTGAGWALRRRPR